MFAMLLVKHLRFREGVEDGPGRFCVVPRAIQRGDQGPLSRKVKQTSGDVPLGLREILL